ncbi:MULTISPECIES: TPM domain-containing protein [unclassified Aeromonas]|uniref:TPM domain-containing protein n=1 Tax=unclassified Aeromonas TaxID=257493 RepID=UPI001C20F979|nr:MULTISPECIES: TPM domain-containing protein [unclassified Aeromonas]QWZ78041.1 TPM domain-containing protein [Aeromonas sp. FDAARGOS 1419]QWZ82124.1 TPM domain-containing protein [Aeromonas sp. FDAARGOS 1414]
MKMMLRWFLPCLLLWASALQAAPDFPTLSGRVVDEASLMSRKQAHQLTQQLAAFEKRSGIQLVVVSVDSLDGETIEEYGYQLGRHWGIGQKDKNSGVLLLIAQDERKVRIEVGYGLEGALPDAIAANIIHGRILPAFKRGDMVAGIMAGSQSIMKALAGEYQPVEQPKSDNGGGPWLFILVVIAMIVLHNLRGGGGGGPGGRRRSTYMAGGLGAGSFGGRSGGGFSGGGGSFGGGGASGGW